MTEQQNKIIDTFEKLQIECMTYHVDWAKLNSHSADYDKDYRPRYPDIVYHSTGAIDALKSMWKDAK